MKKGLKITLIIGAVLVVGIVSALAFNKPKTTDTYVTAKATVGNLQQTVSEVGTVKPIKELELNFEQAGKLSKIDVAVGQIVTKGQILAELDYSSLEISKKEAESALDIALANQTKLIRGASSSEVKVTQARVAQAESAYLAAIKELETTQKTTAEDIAQAQKTLADLQSSDAGSVTSYEQAVATAQISLQNAISTYQQNIDSAVTSAMSTINFQLSLATSALDEVKTILDDDEAAPYLGAKNISSRNETTNNYNQALELLSNAQDDYDLMVNSLNRSDALLSLESSLLALNQTFNTLNQCYSMLQSSTTSISFTQTELDAYIATIVSQRTSINTSITALESSRTSVNNAYLSYQTNVNAAQNALNQAQANLNDAIIAAENAVSATNLNASKSLELANNKVDASKEAWQVAKSELANLQAGARSEDLSLAQSQVDQAQSKLDLIIQQIDDRKMTAPITGKVTEINYEIGEQINLGKSAFKLLADTDYEVDVDISEADINKIKVGNKVEITFDAFGTDQVFAGQVIFIDPAETAISDVIYYQVKIEFVDMSEMYKNQIKPGMTANTTIFTSFRQDVVVVPFRAVIDKNGEGKFIRILDSQENLNEVPVTLGLRGDDGLVEVVSGLSGNETVVTFINK